MANNMEEEDTKRRRSFGRAFGRMESEQSGWGKNRMNSLNLRKKIMISNDFSIIYNLLINGLNCLE